MREVEYAKAWLILTEIGVEMQTFVNPCRLLNNTLNEFICLCSILQII